MSLDEFRLWQQFEDESPLPDLRADIHAAQITTAVVNMAGKAVKEPVQIASQVLFVKRDDPPPKNSPNDLFKGR